MRTVSLLVACALCSSMLGAAMAAEPVAPAKPPTTAALLRERATVAGRAPQQPEAGYRRGVGTIDEVSTWAARLLGAKLEMATTRADRVALLTEAVEFGKARVRDAEARYKTGLVRSG